MASNEHTMNIGSLTRGNVPEYATVEHNSNVTITTPNCNTNIGDTVDGNVDGNVGFDGNINVVAPTSNNNQPQQNSADNILGRGELRRIGDTAYVGQQTAGGTKVIDNIGAVTIARVVNGKIRNNLTYRGDGLEYTNRNPSTGSADEVTTLDNVGTVTMVEQFHIISYHTDVEIAPNNDC